MTVKRQETCEVSAAPGSATGRAVRPSTSPEPTSQGTETPIQEIPIGMPIDADEFRRLKAEAERGGAEAEGETANEDVTPEED